MLHFDLHSLRILYKNQHLVLSKTHLDRPARLWYHYRIEIHPRRNPMKKYLSILLTVLAVLLVILASCVGDDPTPTDTAETTAATDPETTLAPETTQEVTEAPETDPETIPEPETTAEVTAEEQTAE